MMRNYYPKGMPLRDLDHPELALNVDCLNSVPREILNFESPQTLFEREMAGLPAPPST